MGKKKKLDISLILQEYEVSKVSTELMLSQG